MKKFILLVTLFPWLLSAQIPGDGGRKASMQWLDRLSATNSVTLRAATVDNLPDSTYTYYDGVLHMRVSIKYNEDGWSVLEEGFTDFNRDGLVDEDVKVEYTYTREDGYFVQDGISYLKPFNDGVWHPYARAVTRYNANGQPVRTCLYYSLGNGEWEFNQLTGTAEYNERGNPAVVMDSIPFGNGLKAIMRYDMSYDGFDRIVGYIRSAGGETEGTWTPREKVTVAYEGADRHTETHFMPGGDEWVLDYLIETLYDEHGSIIAETKKQPDGNGGYVTVYSDTYRQVYLPDGTTSSMLPEHSRSSVVYPNPSTDCVTVL
ncbi:MAG: hypothetical protein LBL42_05905, partial [Tannerella sp.]|nr:hypothetical protein [Tannerella sp.]